MTTAQLIDALSQPSAYPFPVDAVEVRQTHISILFFTKDQVYKVKKPVDLGFLDFTTLERRRFYCEEEVRLNRRLAPDVYLGVVPILRGDDGELTVGTTAKLDSVDAVEYAVEMRRLPAERMLDRLLNEGVIDNEALDRIVQVLLRFHRTADTEPGVSVHGEPDAVGRAVLDNLAQARAFVGVTLSATLHARLEGTARSFLETRRPLLDRRIREGRIRDGHGDLHAGNICLTDAGIVIYDCIEFDPRLRCGDVAKDLAFLIMDLDYRGFRGFGRYVAHRYAVASDDRELEALLPFYKGHLAAVRGKVASITAGDADLDEDLRTAARREAMRYFHVASTYGLPPALILMCGLPGSGKSWAGQAIARPFEAAIVRSDIVRKRLAGVPVTHHAVGAEAEVLYSRQMSRRTYETMLDEVAALLDDRRSVVVDATFPSAGSRQRFVALAHERGLPWVVVHLTCSDEVIAERMAAREGIDHEVSDADWTVYQSFKASFEPPDEIPAPHLVRRAGTGDPEPIVSEVIDRLIGDALRDDP